MNDALAPSAIQTIPLFELPIIVLPGEVVPLYIFEPRYKRMVQHCCEGEGKLRFGISLRNKEVGTSEFGCLVQILDHQKVDDSGELVIVCLGLQAYRLLAAYEDDQFPKGRIRFLQEEEEPSRAELEKHLREFKRAFDTLEVTFDPLDGAPLSYQAALSAALEPTEKATILGEPNESKRLATVTEMLQYRIAVQATAFQDADTEYMQ